MEIIFGYKAGTEQYSPDKLIEYIKLAEESGFDIMEASDHFHPWSENGQASFTWALLGAVAATTTKIGIGTGVTCPILRYNPAVIAQAAATIATLAPNRTMLGLGTGEALNEYPTTGEWPEYNTRKEMLAEAIIIMRSLWTGKEVTFNGMYYTVKQAKLYTLPRKEIPIYISSLVPNSAYFAGQHGDGIFSVGGKPMNLYKDIINNFESGASENGKNPKSLPRLIEISVAFTKDMQEAIEEKKKYWASTQIPALFNRKIATPKEAEENGKVVGDRIIKSSMCISTSPDDFVEFIKPYIDIGFTHFFFHSAGPDQKAFIEGFGQKVLPVLKKVYS